MGWGNGSGKKEVINASVGDPVICGSDREHPFAGKLVFIDVSGLAHKASKKDARMVVREGSSAKQLEYMRKQISSVAAEGGTPVLVLDGRGYPPKLATRTGRREAAAAARLEAEALEREDGARLEADAKWKAAAGPQEPFWVALLNESLRNEVLFLVSPYEADAQLVSLAQELGDGAIIWAAANDSDIVAFGGLDVVYDWDPFARTFRRVRLLDDILGKVVGKRSFVGWNYDRFLVFTILSGNDYFKNLPGFALGKVWKAMDATPLPENLVSPARHPSLEERPAVWPVLRWPKQRCLATAVLAQDDLPGRRPGW
jgi:exonuclease-1